MIQDKLLKAALCFRDTELWHHLDDSMIFGVKLPNDEIAYCCVMGNNGEHYALGMYKGAEEFSSYYTTSNIANTFSMLETMSAKATFNHVNCDFVNASDLENPDMKDITRQYAKQNGMKVRRSHGYPDFVRYRPFQTELFELNEEEQQWCTTCLQAATLLARIVKDTDDPFKLGFDRDLEYPSPRGGKTVPLVVITEEDGSACTIERTKLPAYIKPKYAQVNFDNDFASFKLKKAEHHPNFVAQCKLCFLPIAFDESKDGIPYALLTACRDQDNYMFKPVIGESYPTSCQESLTEMGEALLEETGFMPTTIEVADDLTSSLLEDFCKRCGIKLKRVSSDKVNMDEFLFQMMEMMIQ